MSLIYNKVNLLQLTSGEQILTFVHYDPKEADMVDDDEILIHCPLVVNKRDIYDEETDTQGTNVSLSMWFPMMEVNYRCYLKKSSIVASTFANDDFEEIYYSIVDAKEEEEEQQNEPDDDDDDDDSPSSSTTLTIH